MPVNCTLDCLCGFAQLAKRRQYVCPTIDESFDLDIKNGRHPVIEKQLADWRIVYS